MFSFLLRLLIKIKAPAATSASTPTTHPTMMPTLLPPWFVFAAAVWVGVLVGEVDEVVVTILEVLLGSAEVEVGSADVVVDLTIVDEALETELLATTDDEALTEATVEVADAVAAPDVELTPADVDAAGGAVVVSSQPVKMFQQIAFVLGINNKPVNITAALKRIVRKGIEKK